MADDECLHVGIEFAAPLHEVAEGHVERPGNVTFSPFVGFANVEDNQFFGQRIGDTFNRNRGDFKLIHMPILPSLAAFHRPRVAATGR